MHRSRKLGDRTKHGPAKILNLQHVLSCSPSAGVHRRACPHVLIKRSWFLLFLVRPRLFFLFRRDSSIQYLSQTQKIENDLELFVVVVVHRFLLLTQLLHPRMHLRCARRPQLVFDAAVPLFTECRVLVTQNTVLYFWPTSLAVSFCLKHAQEDVVMDQN